MGPSCKARAVLTATFLAYSVLVLQGHSAAAGALRSGSSSGCSGKAPRQLLQQANKRGAAATTPTGRASKPGTRACGTRDASSEARLASYEMNQRYLRSNPDWARIFGGSSGSSLRGGGQGQATAWTTIRVCVHQIHSTQGRGAVSRLQVTNQIAVLNSAFRQGYWRFEDDPACSTITVNDAWFVADMGSAEERELKTALHVGGAATLNLYTAELAGGLLGWSTWPWDYTYDPAMDGVMIQWTSLPGGNPPYNQGDTATHEVGHWLGLFHTFGGCEWEDGDLVEDTPAEADANFACNTFKDSCPDDPGFDPVRNFMDYTDDACMDRFTPGQFARMAAIWEGDRLPYSSDPRLASNTPGLLVSSP